VKSEIGGGEGFGQLLRDDADFEALSWEWFNWVASSRTASGTILSGSLGVPLLPRRNGEAVVDVFPLPLVLFESPPRSGRARGRWLQRRCLQCWLNIVIVTLNIAYGCFSVSEMEPSLAQQRCLQRLREELQPFLREAQKLRFGGEDAMRQFMMAHLSSYDTHAHILPLDERAGLPSTAATCDAETVL
jgi:hypothetical protein